MKQALQLKLNQQLTLTPQLQQAIRLLQLSTLDLQQEVQENIESNPMLELNEELSTDEQQSETLNAEQADAALWESSYNYQSHSKPSNNYGDKQQEWQGCTSISLRDHLTWQMELTPFSPLDRAIASAIIDAIDERGFMTSSLEDIQQSIEHEEPPELDEIEAVLHRIQHFDPVSVGARDLRECLLIQLKQLPAEVEFRSQALNMIDHHIHLLSQHDYKQLRRLTKLSETELSGALQLVRTLNPRPGNNISNTEPEYITPDVIVKKRNNRWVVELNPSSTPKLRINDQYAGLVQRGINSQDNNYLRNQLQEARWFIKSLQSRSETLLKVSQCIVEHQKQFLEDGDVAMKPLVLHNVAETVDMHESTVSRVTTQKYIHTPKGVFELKYFFSSHVSTSSGGECSSTAIRAFIKKLLAVENPGKPLSDNKIANLLKDKGINVARRTVAKYREAMGIPPSNERKNIVLR